MENIYLVGFMGTGKTVVGLALAKRTKRKFLDLDDLIELNQRRSISTIFAKSGERYFRSLESKILKEASQEDKFIVACGGGIVIDSKNIKLMKKTGKIICLEYSPEVILKRTSAGTHRPLLNVEDPLKKIKDLLKKRAGYYALADKTIDTSLLTLGDVVNRILK